jgi:hypothetical protein
LNVSFVEETLIVVLFPEITSSNMGYLVAFVSVSSLTVTLPLLKVTQEIPIPVDCNT